MRRFFPILFSRLVATASPRPNIVSALGFTHGFLPTLSIGVATLVDNHRVSSRNLGKTKAPPLSSLVILAASLRMIAAISRLIGQSVLANVFVTLLPAPNFL